MPETKPDARRFTVRQRATKNKGKFHQLSNDAETTLPLARLPEQGLLEIVVPGKDNEGNSAPIAQASTASEAKSGENLDQSINYASEKPVAEATKTKVTSRELQYYIRDRLPLEESESRCFVCRDGTSEDRPLIRCSKRKSCMTHFHEDCLQNYNGGGFQPDYIFCMNKDKPCCPLHHCHACFAEGRKTSAITSDNDAYVQCTKCYIAFHDCCIPSGYELTPELARKYDVDIPPSKLDRYCICPRHASPEARKIIKMPALSSYYRECFECFGEKSDLEMDAKLYHCSRCLRRFHAECYRFRDTEPPTEQVVCEACVLGEFHRVGDYVMTYFGGEWFFAEVVHPSRFPARKAPFSTWNGHPGFVTVRWCGYGDLYSVTPAEYCLWLPDHIQFEPKIERKEKHEERKIPEFRKILNTAVHERLTYQPIETSVYFNSRSQSARTIEDWECGCEVGPGGFKCGPNDSCTNRATDQECTSACGDLCQNRQLAKRDYCGDVEVRLTEEKGKGLFATKDIPAGTFIGEYAGELISDPEEIQNRQEHLYRFHNAEDAHYMMQLEKGRIVDARFKANLSRFINHSCRPNCLVGLKLVELTAKNPKKEKKETKKEKSPLMDLRPYVYTKRLIKAGEELTFFYDMAVYKGAGSLPACYCRAEDCKGQMGRQKKEKGDGRAGSDDSASRSSSGKREAGEIGVKKESSAARRRPFKRAEASNENENPASSAPVKLSKAAPKKRKWSCTSNEALPLQNTV
ncbi:unnamed protein product, partial [Mesorhabditis spiculigera]